MVRGTAGAPCVARGDVAGSSFGFEVQHNGDRWDEKADGSVTRVLLRVKLFDISAVTFPAYPQSQAEARALIAGLLGHRMSRSVAHRMMTLRRRRLEMFERTLAR